MKRTISVLLIAALLLGSVGVLTSCNLNIPFEEFTTPEATTPEVTTPEATTPEVTTPEATTPEVTTPEATTPEVTTPEETTPEVTTPEVTTPEETPPEDPPVKSDYEIWQEYFEAEEKYKQQFPAYMEYVSYHQQYQAAVDKLAMFESIFQADSRGWCMYNDIMGPAVTEVLSKQDLLISSGANADDVHLAGQATENLRVLLKGYNDLRNKAEWSSDHEKYKALYTYYTENYDALEQNFVDLYKTLKGLYENDAVSFYLKNKGKAEHYRQLVGHLFVVATSLDASSQRDENAWRMDRKKLLEVIEEVHYFEDGDWDPRTTAFPTVEVPYVEEPVKPVKPSVPCPPFA